MRKILPLTLAAAVSLVLAGCGGIYTATGPTPPAVASMTDSKQMALLSSAIPFPQSWTHMSANSKRDYMIYNGLHAIALEGKNMGYSYFALTAPAVLDNVSGSSIVSAHEVFLLCGAAGAREFFTTASQCDGIKGEKAAIYYQAVFFREKPIDFLVWDIEKTLADPLVNGTDADYEHEPLYEGDWRHVATRGMALPQEPE